MEYSDLMNETLLIAFTKFNHIKNKNSLLSYLCGVSIKILANDNRKKKAKTKMTNTDLILIDVNSNTDKDVSITLLYEAMSLLPLQQRECLILFEIIGFSIKEIMEIQNSSESAVKQRLKRGRERLKLIITFESNYKRGEVKHEL